MVLKWGDLHLSDDDEPRGSVTISKAITTAPRHRGEVKATKTEKVRTVELPSFAVKALLDVRRERVCPAESFVVTERDPDRVTRAWRALADSLDLPEGLRLHDLRHSYATALLESGAGIRELQEALGHTTATTTMTVYAHVTERLRERRRETLERAFSGTPEHSRSISDADVVPLRGRSEG